jgi:AraC-like DNA-binding protein
LAEVERPKAACALVLKTLAPIRRQLLRNDRVTADFFTRLGRYVREHLDDDLRLLAVASDLGLAPSTVTRRLERRYGLTFTGYVARQRVERAKSMLQRTGLSVEIIARRVGLTDSAHLRKLLQRFDGVSPSQVRAKRPTRRAAG